MVANSVRGDFNLIRNDKERNKGHGDTKLMNMFNDFIGDFQLKDIFVSGMRYIYLVQQASSPSTSQIG